MKNNLPAPTPASAALFLSFHLGDRRCAIPFLRVAEVRTLQTMMPVLRAPDYGTGQVCLQGRGIPLIDLRVRFGVPPRFDQATRIIIGFVSRPGADDGRAALLVDSIEDVIELNQCGIGSVQGDPQREDFSSAGVASDGSPVFLVDINRLMGKAAVLL